MAEGKPEIPLRIKYALLDLYHPIRFHFSKESSSISVKSPRRTPKYEKEKYDKFQFSIEDCLNFIQSLKNIPEKPDLEYRLDISGLEGKNLEEWMARCLVGAEYSKITIFGRDKKEEALSFEEMNFLMDIVNPDVFLEMKCDVKEGYKNEKTLQSKSFHYHHSHWITLEDLTSIRNYDEVHLESTNFSNKDINQFLKYWVNCEEPMVNKLTIEWKNGEYCLEEKVFDGLEYITGRGNFLKSSTKIASISIFPSKIQLQIVKSMDEIFQNISELKILNAKNLKNSEELAGYRLILEDYEDGSEEKNWLEETIRRLEQRKKAAENRLDGLEFEIKRAGFRVENLSIY